MPNLAVIIPCHNGADDLGVCLSALSRSTFKDFECIVVDDASTDDSASTALASVIQPRLLRLSVQSGAGAARNAGCRIASAPLLAFLDADVAVHPDTLARIAAAFEEDTAMGALIGAYDDEPADQHFYSQFRNLLHCYVHCQGSREASTFWTGCGAVWRKVFEDCGGFEPRAHIEDIELGYRLCAAGVRIASRPEIQVKHLKRWKFWSTVKTDLVYRGIPWTLLILRTRHLPNDLNVRFSQRVSVALAFLGAVGLLLSAAWPALLGISVLSIVGAALINTDFYHFLSRRRGRAFAAMGTIAHLLHLAINGVALISGLIIFPFSRSDAVAFNKR